MDYALAKQLKEAGFPQREDRSALYPRGYVLSGTKNGVANSQKDRAYPPTLEELIEACGTNIVRLEYYSHPAHNCWWALGSR
jgi:hypothetical protein